MADNLTKAQRRATMASVKSVDTGPEMIVRHLTHGLGYRYRLHRKDLPGKPDLVFPGRKKIIFVHGCFWHDHEGCPAAKKPASNQDYWLTKLHKNKTRDKNNMIKLQKMGWSTLIIWECETKNKDCVINKINSFLGGSNGN